MSRTLQERYDELLVVAKRCLSDLDGDQQPFPHRVSCNGYADLHDVLRREDARVEPAAKKRDQGARKLAIALRELESLEYGADQIVSSAAMRILHEINDADEKVTKS